MASARQAQVRKRQQQIVLLDLENVLERCHWQTKSRCLIYSQLDPLQDATCLSKRPLPP